MPTLANLVRCSVATTGTGTVTVGSAVSGFLTPALAGVSDSNIVVYCLIDDNGNSETGLGTYASGGPTISRDTVYDSTNSGSKINLSGSAVITLTVAAETLQSLVDLSTVSQAEAEAGTATTDRLWTAQRVSQAITALAGGGGGAITPISKTSASASSTIDIALSGGYRRYLVRIADMVPATDGTALTLRISDDSAVSFEVSNYDYGVFETTYAGGPTRSGGVGTIGITLAQSIGNAASEALFGDIIISPADGTYKTQMTGILTSISSALTSIQRHDAFGSHAGTTAVTHIRFLMSSGNITSGDFHLYGIEEGA